MRGASKTTLSGAPALPRGRHSAREGLRKRVCRKLPPRSGVASRTAFRSSVGSKTSLSEAPASKPRRFENGSTLKRGLANSPCVRSRLASRLACRSRRSSSTTRARRYYLDAFLNDTKHLVKGVPQTRCSGIRLPRGGSHDFFLFKRFFFLRHGQQHE